GPRGRGALGPLLRVRPRRRRGVQRLRRPRRRDRVREPCEGPGDARGIQPGEHEHVHRLDQERSVRGHPRRRRMRGMTSVIPDLEQASAQEVLAYALENYPNITMACSFQKEESVLVHMLT